MKSTDFSIEENEDGSITVWCNEVERMFRTPERWPDLHCNPDKAYLEIKARLYNRTRTALKLFYGGANPAVVCKRTLSVGLSSRCTCSV